MKFRLFSDLHTEFSKFKNWKLDECKDVVLILAGDIGVGLSARAMIEGMCNAYKAVILVPGNHEYYNQHIDEIDERFAIVDKLYDNFHYLQNRTVYIDDVRIIGGTMWTDLNKGDWFTTFNAHKKMNDYQIIRYHDANGISIKFSPSDSRQLFSKFKAHLESELSKEYDGKTVVVTHHAPCELSVADQFKGNSLNYAYYEDMTQYMLSDNAPSHWLNGHIHNSTDYIVGNTRIISNPYGYHGHSVNNSFDPKLIFEV
jgi:Icc-related predicted phosphoesterase